MSRFAIVHYPAHGRIDNRPLSSRPNRWDVVDTASGAVVFETYKSAAVAEDARAEWEAHPDQPEFIVPGVPGDE